MGFNPFQKSMNLAPHERGLMVSACRRSVDFQISEMEEEVSAADHVLYSSVSPSVGPSRKESMSPKPPKSTSRAGEGRCRGAGVRHIQKQSREFTRESTGPDKD